MAIYSSTKERAGSVQTGRGFSIDHSQHLVDVLIEERVHRFLEPPFRLADSPPAAQPSPEG